MDITVQLISQLLSLQQPLCPWQLWEHWGMMKPYMGAYGIMKKLLEQPCNLELQIYWEPHGLLRLESKQWGTLSQGPAEKEVTRTIMLPISTNGIICAVCSCETYSCNVAIGPNNRNGKSFEYRQQEWANGSIITDWVILCK